MTASLAGKLRDADRVHAELAGDRDGVPELTVASFVGRPDGSACLRDEVAGGADAPAELGRLAGERWLAAGAAEVLAAEAPRRP